MSAADAIAHLTANGFEPASRFDPAESGSDATAPILTPTEEKVVLAVLGTLLFGTFHVASIGIAAAGGAIQGALIYGGAGPMAATMALVTFVTLPTLVIAKLAKKALGLSENKGDILESIAMVASMALGYGSAAALGLISVPAAATLAGTFILIGATKPLEKAILRFSEDNKETVAIFTLSAKVALVAAGVIALISFSVMSPLLAVGLGVVAALYLAKSTYDNLQELEAEKVATADDAAAIAAAGAAGAAAAAAAIAAAGAAGAAAAAADDDGSVGSKDD